MAIGRMPDADAQARKCICVEMMNNVFQSIVSGGAAPCSQAYFANWQVKLVVDNQHVFRLDFIPAYDFSDRLTAEIHKGNRLSQHDFFSTNSTAC